MSSNDNFPDQPATPEAREGVRVGVDDWVAEADERLQERPGLAGLLRRFVDAVPAPVRLALFVGFVATLPFWMDRGDLFSYGLFTLIYIILGLGLNVVVGYAGLLDLGYVAFFGFGAYFYGLLSSTHTDKGYTYDIHLPAQWSIPIVVVATALLGLLLGFTSRRLLGDYLAIVTLFFGQAFVAFVVATDWRGLTGGPNGIADIDPLNFFGYELTSRTQQFYFLLIVFVLVVTALYFVSESRTGRAWRALREDPLAAEAMSMPVNRLKILAFVFGAAIAGLAGCIFASILTAVTGGNFDLPVLITIYAIVILGGLGSLTGVVVGAIVINVSFQVLAPENPQSNARLLFYGVILLLIVLQLRPWWRLGIVLGGVLALGYAAHAIVEAAAPSWTSGAVVEPGRFGSFVENWVIIPAGHDKFGEIAYIALIAALLTLTLLRGWVRTIALIPTIYLAAIVWENILVENPAVARWILFGTLLVVLMNVRPQGLLGTARVEIV